MFKFGKLKKFLRIFFPSWAWLWNYHGRKQTLHCTYINFCLPLFGDNGEHIRSANFWSIGNSFSCYVCSIIEWSFDVNLVVLSDPTSSSNFNQLWGKKKHWAHLSKINSLRIRGSIKEIILQYCTLIWFIHSNTKCFSGNGCFNLYNLTKG